MKYIYLIKLDEYYKIGVSNDVEKRKKQLATGTPEDHIIIKKFKSKYPFKVENLLHRTFKSKLINKEWFDLTTDDINNFNNLCEKYEYNFDILLKNDNPFTKKYLKNDIC